MLQKLTIRNYALIESLELEFEPGLTIITGETGAGKSIMLGALSLLKGGRADTKAIADGSRKSVVEASFSQPDGRLEPFFADNDLDWNPAEIIIRREIAQTGRSRIFINDCPANLSQLSELGMSLLDIHSQHENARLADNRVQLDIVDAMSDNEELRRQYSEAFHSFVEIRNRIRRLRDEQERLRADRQLLELRYEGLKALNPKRGELEEIERRFELLSDADEIRERLQNFASLLGENERGVIDTLRTARGEADKIGFGRFRKSDEEDASDVPSRLESIIAELKDIYETADERLAQIDCDPTELSRLSKRMNDYYDAIRQYKVKGAGELADLYEETANRLASISGESGTLPELEKEGKRSAAVLKELGELLSDSRRKGAGRFAESVEKAARPLGLPNVSFGVSLTAGKLGPTGQDKPEFVGAFNKNQTAGVLSRMASGGEMARLMLAIKSVLAGKMSLPTIIFDEIDTGVSGEIADKMGSMMLAMGSGMQVIAITHLPQVASKGASHFKVYKEDGEERTQTHVVRLDREGRVRELAAMMSGSEVGEAALRNARLLLGEKE